MLPAPCTLSMSSRQCRKLQAPSFVYLIIPKPSGLCSPEAPAARMPLCKSMRSRCESRVFARLHAEAAEQEDACRLGMGVAGEPRRRPAAELDRGRPGAGPAPTACTHVHGGVGCRGCMPHFPWQCQRATIMLVFVKMPSVLAVPYSNGNIHTRCACESPAVARIDFPGWWTCSSSCA